MMESQNNQSPGPNDATLVAPRAQQGAARLILRRADGQLKEYGLDKDEITIGRLTANDVSLPDDRSVSRRHAVIRRSNVGYVIEDQQSNNGTYVDGEKILYPFVLHNGQSIKIGANELTFTISSAQINTAGQPEAAMPPVPAAPSQLPSMAPTDQPFNQPPTQPDFDALPPQMAGFPPPPQPTPAFQAPQPAPAFQEQQPAFPPSQPAPAFQQPAPAFPPQPAFQPQPPAPSFQQPQPAPAFQQPAPGFPPPPAPEPAFPQFPIPSQPAPSFPAAPAQSSAGSGMVICPSCGSSTMANKAFCLNCGASMAAQGPAAAPAVQAGSNPFGGPPPGGFASSPGNLPPGPAFGQPPPNNPQPWPQPPAQGWPGQPGQPAPFGAAPAGPPPATGPIDASAFFSKGMRPLQTSDIRVRLATQFAAPGAPPPGTMLTVRIWSPAQDAFYLSGPGITLRVPAPGGVEEGVLQVTPLRATPPGVIDQLLFMVVDATTSQPLHPAPLAADILIAYQPAPSFDGPGSLRLPI